jgi:hypothetical protein
VRKKYFTNNIRGTGRKKNGYKEATDAAISLVLFRGWRKKEWITHGARE